MKRDERKKKKKNRMLESRFSPSEFAATNSRLSGGYNSSVFFFLAI